MENKEVPVDIIIPVYNGEKFIADAINSVQKQSWENWKLMVVNDGSTDNTAAIVEDLIKSDARISILHQKNSGVSIAVNLALEHSSAEFIALLDADDLWHEQKLEKQMEALEKHRDHNICFTYLQEFENFESLQEKAGFSARAEPIKGYSKTTILVRRLVFEKYGNFDTKIATGDFVEWYSRALRHEGKDGLMLEEVLAFRRVHGNNMTRTIDKNAYLHILKSHIDAKRKNS